MKHVSDNEPPLSMCSILKVFQTHYSISYQHDRDVSEHILKN